MPTSLWSKPEWDALGAAARQPAGRPRGLVCNERWDVDLPALATARRRQHSLRMQQRRASRPTTATVPPGMHGAPPLPAPAEPPESQRPTTTPRSGAPGATWRPAPDHPWCKTLFPTRSAEPVPRTPVAEIRRTPNSDNSIDKLSR